MFHALREEQFLLSEPWTWDCNSILAYLDRAGIGMQMLSRVPSNVPALRAANDYGISIVQKHPSRFGLLAALPTDNPEECLAEISRTSTTFSPTPDGFAVMTDYNNVMLSHRSLEPVWAKLNELSAVVHVHPNAFAGPSQGRPSPLIEVAFDTARTAVDMLYKGIFRRYPDIRFVLAHSGGALPVLYGRLKLLGTEEWVPNPEKITREEIETQLAGLYVDTAATASTGLAPAMGIVGAQHCIYGADCGVPCSTEANMEENRMAVMTVEEKVTGGKGTVGANGWALFPEAAKRAEKGVNRYVHS